MSKDELIFTWWVIVAVACLASRWFRIAKSRSRGTRRFICYYYFVSWWHWSLGIHFDPYYPQLEIHLPGGFVRVGRSQGLRIRKLRTGAIGLTENGWIWHRRPRQLWEDQYGGHD